MDLDGKSSFTLEMPPIVVNNPLQQALRYATPPLKITSPGIPENNSRVAFSPLAYNSIHHTYGPPHSPVKLSRNMSRRNLSNPYSRGQLTKTPPYTIIKKTAKFSNGSRPGNNINPYLPKSNQSMTSNKTFGSFVVPPTNVGNTYSTRNYNRSYSTVRYKKSRKNRKTRRNNYN